MCYNFHVRPARPSLIRSEEVALVAARDAAARMDEGGCRAVSARPYGMAIAGCGVIASFHARAIAGLPNARLRDVADVAADDRR
jgi:hypothetical protein